MTLRIVIEPAQLVLLLTELHRAHGREIGGVLVGEHVGAGVFRLLDLSVQRRGGGRAHFDRDPAAAAAFVDAAIRGTGGDPTRVNYLGEWHSHPGMTASPSTTDVLQMQAIMEDDAEVATFGVLLVVSARSNGLELSATLFRAGHPPEPVAVEVPQGGVADWRQAPSDTVDEHEAISPGAPVAGVDSKENAMTTLRDRFDDEALVEAMLRQRLVNGDRNLAASFIRAGGIVEYAADQLLTTQGDWDDDLHFILAGEFDVIINGRQQARRGAGVHVGEFAGLNQARPRTATLRAVDDALVLTVSRAALKGVVEGNATFWKTMADVAVDRLEERNAEIGMANEHPRVFVISSSEGLEVARLVRQELDGPSIHVQLWNRGTFLVSDYAMSSLEDAIEAADFAIAVVRADDVLVTRDATVKVARDNVHLEYGIAVGKLGLKRAFLLVDAGEGVTLPSDLAGLTTLRYRSGSRDEISRTVAKACDAAREKLEYIGVRRDRRAC